MPDRLLSTSQAARYLGVHPSTLTRAVRRGRIVPRIRTPGGFLRFAVEDLDRLSSSTGAGPSGRGERRVVGTPKDFRDQLRVLSEAALSLTSELSLDRVLQKIVHLARKLAGARYAALGVLDSEGHISQFLTSGITETQRRHIGQYPTGRGLLGVMIRESKALRVKDIAKDSRSVGFPAHHPLMRTLLGVAITYQGRVIGDLYLCDKVGEDDFSKEDESLIQMLAHHAGVAIENARLYQQVQRMAIVEDRERIGKDLHDGIIQSIYAVGLNLAECIQLVGDGPQEAKARLEHAVDSLDGVIRDIRNYIFDLRPQLVQDKGLREGLEEIVREFTVNTLVEARLEISNEITNHLPPSLTINLLQIAREALSNIARHAQATLASVRLDVCEEGLTLAIEDNGLGFDPNKSSDEDKHGLRNMRERARSLGGALTIGSAAGAGTRLLAQLPMPQEEDTDGY